MEKKLFTDQFGEVPAEEFIRKMSEHLSVAFHPNVFVLVVLPNSPLTEEQDPSVVDVMFTLNSQDPKNTLKVVSSFLDTVVDEMEDVPIGNCEVPNIKQ